MKIKQCGLVYDQVSKKKNAVKCKLAVGNGSSNESVRI